MHPEMNGVFSRISEAYSKCVQVCAPGIDAQSLATGWIDVPEAYICRRLQSQVKPESGVKRVSLSCGDGSMQVRAWTRRLMLEHEWCLGLSIDSFVYGSEVRMAAFRAGEDIELAGRNLLGQISVGIASSFLKRVFRQRVKGSLEKTNEAVRVDWPFLRVDLSKVEKPVLVREVEALRIPKVGSALDLITIAEARICPGRVSLKLAPGPATTAALPRVNSLVDGARRLMNNLFDSRKQDA